LTSILNIWDAGLWLFNFSVLFIFSRFTTEVLGGFDIQRTSGYADTERLYVRLTCSIIEYYSTNFSNLANNCHVCLTYNEFERRCKDFEKSTVSVSQIFGHQLMQVT
jgi:crossover junction endonuclease MUS81